MVSLLAQSEAGLKQLTMDQVLSPYVFVFYAAYLVSFFFTPILRVVAVYYGIIDEPDGMRKMHTKPVAYLGGVAVFLGWMAGLAFSQFVQLHHFEEGMAVNHPLIDFNIVIGACVIVLLGLWDDVLSLSPKVKIAGQVVAALCLLWSGIGRRAAWVFLSPILLRTKTYLGFPEMPLELVYQHWAVGAASAVFVIALVVGCCNATNLMDGLDGLCGGVTAVVVGGFLFLAVNLAVASGMLDINQDAMRVVMALALLGAVLGFVPYNFNPASIFMGDTGSMFLGYVCATIMILFASTGHFKWFLASMVMFSLPILDTALAFTRRWVNRRPLFSADRHHFHHQLVARGFTVKRTVIISYGLSLLFCLLGAAIVYIRTRYAVAVYLFVFGSITVAAYKMGMVHERVGAVTRRPLGTGQTLLLKEQIEPGSVLDVREALPQPKFADRPPDAAGERPTEHVRT
jgi:UDP-GlcNAc:undecaprenyl-phosphate/decaprenyl-phosphate GlcNAc-1-phosphate transferase